MIKLYEKLNVPKTFGLVRKAVLQIRCDVKQNGSLNISLATLLDPPVQLLTQPIKWRQLSAFKHGQDGQIVLPVLLCCCQHDKIGWLHILNIQNQRCVGKQYGVTICPYCTTLSCAVFLTPEDKTRY